jgi:ribosomal protein S18 acetylase RimI-like enzyme
MEGTVIRPASAGDAAALSAFARRVFDEVFGPPNDPDDMAAYLGEAFSPEIQRSEITAAGSIILLAVDASGALSGYLYIGAAETPSCVTGPTPVELKRIYVDPACHSRGLGKRLLDEGLARAKAAGAGTIWLGVWERNFGAQRFYSRAGFERVGDHPFVLGSDVQTDWIMQRSLA